MSNLNLGPGWKPEKPKSSFDPYAEVFAFLFCIIFGCIIVSLAAWILISIWRAILG